MFFRPYWEIKQLEGEIPLYSSAGRSCSKLLLLLSPCFVSLSPRCSAKQHGGVGLQNKGPRVLHRDSKVLADFPINCLIVIIRSLFAG